MNRKAFGLFIMVALVVACHAASWAKDIMRYEPRTPAGGARVADMDYYFGMIRGIEYGPSSFTLQNRTTIGEQWNYDSRVLGYGYFETDETGRVVYYFENGERVDMRQVGTIENNPIEGQPNHVKYWRPPGSISTQILIPEGD